MNDEPKKEITLREHLKNAGKARWATKSELQKSEHAKMMNLARWEKYRQEHDDDQIGRPKKEQIKKSRGFFGRVGDNLSVCVSL